MQKKKKSGEILGFSVCRFVVFVLFIIHNLIYGIAARYRKILYSSVMWIWEYFMCFTTHEFWLLFLALFVYSIIVPCYCTWDVCSDGWRCSPRSLEIVFLEILQLHLDDEIVLLYRLYRENHKILNII